MVTHLAHQNKALVWEALHATYKMYLLHGFRIAVIAGDQEFASISDLVVQLPTTPSQIRLGSSFIALWIDRTEHQISQGEDPFSLPQSTL
jgi:hypothetical protein